MQVKIKKLHPSAQKPTYGSEGAAAFDVYALERTVVPACSAETVATGISFELPPNHALFVYSRSGHGFKHGIRLANSVGVLDADYRGGLFVRLANDSLRPYTVQAGERIAQCVVMPVPHCEFEEVHALEYSARGENGFGSTGR